MRILLFSFLILVSCAPTIDRTVKSDNAVINGEDAFSANRFASAIVSLWYPDNGDYCTGTVISEHIVLTAAHCYSEVQPYICFSHINPRTLSAGEKIADSCVRAQSSLEHRLYTEKYEGIGENIHDIRVVSFQAKLPDGVIPMPLVAESFKPTFQETVTLVGFGKTSMQPELVPDSALFADLTLTRKHSNTEYVIDSIDGKGACHGDSGGPIYSEINGQKTLIGIVNRGATPESGSTCKGGFIALDLRPFLSWIQESSAVLISELPK